MCGIFVSIHLPPPTTTTFPYTHSHTIYTLLQTYYYSPTASIFTHHPNDTLVNRVCVYIHYINTHIHTYTLPTHHTTTIYVSLYILQSEIHTHTHTPQKHHLIKGPPNISHFFSLIPPQILTKRNNR